MKRILLNLLPVILLWLGICLIARGDPPLGCCEIQLATTQLEDCSDSGEFQPATAAALETATVTLQFDASLAGTAVAVQALDGGTLGINGSTVIDQTGNLSFPFQVGALPGLYRVSVVAQYESGDVPVALVQFQVPSPE
jgi:hypothetical protein